MAWNTATNGQHPVVKPEKIAATAAAALEQQLVVPTVFTREGIENFVGAEGDTINVKVEGVLPYRTFGWRADRATAVVELDTYKERTVPVTFGGDMYSGVGLTDEQFKMDFDGWAKLATKQTEAIGRGLEYEACDAVRDAPYEVVVTLDRDSIRTSIIQLKGIMDALKAPGRRTILANPELEALLLSDQTLSSVLHVGEGDGLSALHEATLGRRFGFDFVSATDLADSVSMTEGAFIFATGAPDVPESVPFGASASVNGVAIRWIRDYDSMKFRDRSIFNLYYGYRHVTDPLLYRDRLGQAFVTEGNHFVRAVKVEIGNDFGVEVGNEDLADATGLASTDGTNDGA